MYYLYAEKTSIGDTWYCLVKGTLRTAWEPGLLLALTRPLTQTTNSSYFLNSTLIYSGSTVPTIESNPELFI